MTDESAEMDLYDDLEPSPGTIFSRASNKGGSTNYASSVVSSSTADLKRRSSYASTIISSSTVKSFDNMWTHMSKYWAEGDGFEEADDDDELSYNFKDCSTFCMQSSKVSVTSLFKLMKRNLWIPVVSAITFTFFLIIGLLVVRSFERSYVEDLSSKALTLAQDTGNYFSSELDKALVPMFSLGQVVKHDDQFRALSNEIKNVGEPGAAPLREDVVGFRDVTGICDKPELQAKFDEVVYNILGDATMRGTVANMQLAPNAVQCLSSPLVNNKDFAIGVYNTSKSIGKDWVNIDNPMLVKTAKLTIASPTNEITFIGPIALKSPQGEILTEKAFCTHLSVNLESENLMIEGRSYPSWGYVQSYINWERILKDEGVYDKFADAGMAFQLYREDTKTDENGNTQTKDVVLAESDNSHILYSQETISTSVETANSVWNVKVGYVDGLRPPWLVSAKIAVLVLSSILSILVLLIHAEKYKNQLLLYKMLPKKAIKKLNRGQTVVDRFGMVTIFFSDIVGFTSLASTMRPVEIMEMLNDVYREFDKLVAKHNVYKVETIGDAYMVIGGAPKRCMSVTAAENVALFALDAIECVKTLRLRNGGRIFIRAGLASGPVVAGVVGDAMPRYCFFGDTVNFASRMESTSKKLQIQCCDTTSRLLANATKHNFKLDERVDEHGNTGVEMKGKGVIHTWWIQEARDRNDAVTEIERCETPSGSSSLSLDSDFVRRINYQGWIDLGKPCQPAYSTDINEMKTTLCAILTHRLEKLTESRGNSGISTFTPGSLRGNFGSSGNIINPLSTSELISRYVDQICNLYIINDYHNFHHAYHVTISINKLVEMIIMNHGILYDDYLTHFSLVFSALVHDVAHKGIPNFILVNLEDELAKTYNKTSMAEKNSLNISLDILNEDSFSSLRKKIYGPNKIDGDKFESIIKTTILCTDIFNASRISLTKDRYAVAFSKQDSDCKTSFAHNQVAKDCNDLNELEIDKICIFPDDCEQACLQKTCIIEHLIQVADVAHNYQSWEVFIKWNYRLLKELMVCHQSGWMGDVTTTWVKSQKEFTDSYALPLISRVQGMHALSDYDNNIIAEAVESIKHKWEVDGEEICSKMQHGVRIGEDEELVMKKILSIESSHSS